MEPTTTSDLTINQLLFTICSMSPSAKRSIELELYRQNIPLDSVTDQYILEDALVNLMQDLTAIGLTFSIDLSEVIESLGTLQEFIDLASYLLPGTLYDRIKHTPALKECITQLLNGSIGEDQPLLQSYLTELGGLEGHPALVPDLTEITDQYVMRIEQSSVFSDYFQALLAMVNQERIEVEIDAETLSVYQRFTKEFVGRLSDALNLFSDHALYEEASAIQDHIIHDLISPVNVVDYHYLFVIPEDTLPEDIKASHRRKREYYALSSPWCQQYYRIRKVTPSPAMILMMYCFQYAMQPDVDHYHEATRFIAQLFPNMEYPEHISALYTD